MENIVFKIAKLNAQSDELKQLHRACFGKPGAKLMIKKNLREFSGFVADDMTAEKAKKLAMVLKNDLKVIKGMLDTCDLSPGGTKAEAAARLIDFLEALARVALVRDRPSAEATHAKKLDCLCMDMIKAVDHELGDGDGQLDIKDFKNFKGRFMATQKVTQIAKVKL